MKHALHAVAYVVQFTDHSEVVLAHRLKSLDDFQCSISLTPLYSMNDTLELVEMLSTENALLRAELLALKGS